MRRHWADFVKRDQHGHEHVILESVSEGVVFTSFERSVGEADSAAFLRTRLEPARVRECIARAFSHAGKPYDFESDFFSTDKLVCTHSRGERTRSLCFISPRPAKYGQLDR